MDHCVSLLTGYEQKHGVTLIAPGLQYESGNNGIEVVNDPRVGHLVDPDDLRLKELLKQKLFPFLTDTCAVLAPSYPDECDTVFLDRYFYHGTARAIANTYAEWATQEEWLGKSNWSQAELYYSQCLSENVYDWVKLLYNVVVTKCARSPQTSG